MNKTGFLYDERYLRHHTGSWHPEIPARLEVIYRGLEQAGLLSKILLIQADRADLKWVESIHEKKYIKRFKKACDRGKRQFDYPDNQMCAETFEVALLAVGGILKAVDLVMEKHIQNAFCAVRPPGHHAEKDKAMGFCYFNNIAVAARYLRMKWGITKVAILDFDVHHGNGTQNIFEDDPSVLYCSLHEHPTFAFPGTGREFEKGVGTGMGYTVNVPLLPNHGDKEYKALMEKKVLSAMDGFEPEFILVSTGFDAHKDDELSNIALTGEAFVWVMESMVDLAKKHSAGRIVSVLEGGYSLKRLPELAADHVRVLLSA